MTTYDFEENGAEELEQAPAPPMPDLTPGELDEFAECERITERGFAEFVAVGTAISIVRKKMYYRKKYRTFEEYMSKRWGVSARQAYRLCDAAEVVRHLTPPGDPFPSFVLPASESQVRPLKELPAEKRRDAWTAALAESPAGRPTARIVRAVVDRILGRETEAPTSNILDNLQRPSPNLQLEPKGGTPNVIDLAPALSKEARVKEQADRAIRELRELISLTGTADSQKAAGLQLALEELQDFRDHRATIEQRAAGRR